jgi:hypothetical protein
MVSLVYDVIRPTLLRAFHRLAVASEDALASGAVTDELRAAAVDARAVYPTAEP